MVCLIAGKSHHFIPPHSPSIFHPQPLPASTACELLAPTPGRAPPQHTLPTRKADTTCQSTHYKIEFPYCRVRRKRQRLRPSRCIEKRTGTEHHTTTEAALRRFASDTALGLVGSNLPEARQVEIYGLPLPHVGSAHWDAGVSGSEEKLNAGVFKTPRRRSRGYCDSISPELLSR